MVGTANRSTNAPSDAAVVRVKTAEGKTTDKSIVITVDCNSRYVNANPFVGAQIAVAEAARNIVCSGGEPIAVTNNLNFGNPYVPEVYWQFVEAVKGMGEACIRFDTPVTGGNVSFYNQSSDDGPVFPTPTIGMLGLMENFDNHTTLNFKQATDRIYLLGAPVNDIASSEYLYSFRGVKASPAPAFDMEAELAMQRALSQLITKKLIQSAHDLSDGGLFVALAESAMAGGLGFDITTGPAGVLAGCRLDAVLFGEGQGRVVVSVSAEKQAAFEEAVAATGVPCAQLGLVTERVFLVDGQAVMALVDAKELYDNALGKIMA